MHVKLYTNYDSMSYQVITMIICFFKYIPGFNGFVGITKQRIIHTAQFKQTYKKCENTESIIYHIA